MQTSRFEEARSGVMLMNILVSPWKGGTPRRLANALKLNLRTPKELSRIQFKSGHLRYLINWGCIAPIQIGQIHTLNRAPAVASAANKLATFRILTENKVPTLEFTKDKEVAKTWLPNHSVFAHTDLHGHSGSGLVLIPKGSKELPDAKVYTKYFPKKVESRVHVFRSGLLGQFDALYLQKKRVSKERYDEFGLKETPTTYVRTYQNGWIFAREVEEDKKAIDLACRTAALLQLDYGAVDIMSVEDKYVVGEVNTAPGLEGECLAFYVNHFKRAING